MVRDNRRHVMRTAIAAVIAMVGLAATAGAHGSSGASRDEKIMVKCQRQIADEGIALTGRLSWKMARCVLPLGDCSVDSAGRPGACDRAARACRSLPGEVAGLKGRFVSRVASACSGMGMDKLVGGLKFNQQMADCTVTTPVQFATCLAENLHASEAESIVRMAPAACSYIQAAGITAIFPASMCLDGASCEEDPGDPTDPPPTCEGDLFCGGADGVTCPDGMVCDRTDPMCGMPDGAGVCVTTPTACDPGTPVCGCDGQTYASNCARVMAGAVLGHDGACSVGCFSNEDCGQGQFCDLPAGDCGESQMGACQPMDDAACTMCGEYLGTVCGCDGLTYASDCTRRAAGISKFSTGSCPFF